VAKFAIVAPINVIDELYEVDALGTTHLLLAHDVVKHPDAYRHYFHPSKMISSSRNVILDHSVIELGKAVDNHTMIEAAKIVHPTTVVLPDVLLDMKATIDAVNTALGVWEKEPFLQQTQYTLCLQGKNTAEYLNCAYTFSNNTRIGMWGVPRDALKVMPSRKPLIERLQLITPEKRIHLLGFSDNIMDDISCSLMPKVQSIDSAVPLRFQQLLNPLSKVPPRGDWWDNAPKLNRTTLNNLRRVRYWIGDSSIKDSI
jgi:hypothetical protein